MSFIDDSEKNIKKILNEVITSVGAVGSFTGRAGIGIDNLFAGGFHPKFGELKKLLDKQLEDREEKIKDTESIEANPVGGYNKLDIKHTLDAYKELFAKIENDLKYNEENTPEHDVEWKSTGVNIDFDDIYTHIENEEDFINQSEKNMELVGIDIKYDDKPEYAGEDFINKSETNWKLVRRK